MTYIRVRTKHNRPPLTTECIGYVRSLMETEIEVKFHITDRQAIRRRILSFGASSDGRVFETNIRFDTPGDDLLRSGALLRLRRDSRSILTYKSRPSEKDPEFKVYSELEVTVGDHDSMRRILEALGFKAVQLYEKYRETFSFDRAVICLDTMPFGEFIEIEGERDAIRDLAKRLSLDWDCRILLNYLEIFKRLRACLGFSFTDPTFHNFRTVPQKVDASLNQTLLQSIST